MISVRVLLEKQIQININTVNYLDFKGDDRTTVDPSYYIMIAGRTKSVMTVKTAYL